MAPRPIPLEGRFWSKVDKSGECWLWTGGTNPKGYGKIKINGKWQLAHRVAYELQVGPIPPGLFACHHCDTPLCVRPEHLFLGTPRDNAHDMMAKGRHAFVAGSNNPNARLTQQQVDEMRRLRKTGNYTFIQLGAMYGVSASTVGRIFRGNLWLEPRAEETGKAAA